MGLCGHSIHLPVSVFEGGGEAMKHGSLFTGIAGFDLAATWAGFTNVFAVEIDPENRNLLTLRHPELIIHDDITTFDGHLFRGSVDIISGGFPCQPFSLAGKRKGTEDDRFLWKEMFRVIKEVQPSYVLGENVIGLLSIERGMVFKGIISDLASEGYKVWTTVLPAASVGAPHQRYRVWIAAHRNGTGLQAPWAELQAARFEQR